MSTAILVEDQRIDVLNGAGPSTFKYGRYRSRNTSGGDQVTAEREFHPYSGTHVDYFSGSYLYRTKLYSNPWGEWREYGPLNGTVTQLRPWTADDDLKLIGKLREKFDNHDFNGSVMAGEMGKAADSLAARARQLGLAARAARRGNLAEAGRVLGMSPGRASNAVKRGDKALQRAIDKRPKGKLGPSGERDYHPDNFKDERFFGSIPSQDRQRISDAHLELQYGMLPLINDVYALSGALQARTKPRERRIYARRYIGKSVGSSFPTIFAANGTGRYQKQIICYVEEEVPTFAESMGLTNPASVLWELTPWSFVADWFLPIGNYIEARSFAARAKGTFISTTTDWHRIRSAGMASTYVPDYVPPEQSEYKINGLWWNSSVSISRTISTSLSQSVPLPTFKSPFVTGAPMTRLANALALVAGMFGRK